MYIHNLLDSSEKQASKGRNPFDDFTLNEGKTKLSSVVKAYDPPYLTSTKVYEHIESNLEDWVEEAISIRDDYVAG